MSPAFVGRTGLLVYLYSRERFMDSRVISAAFWKKKSGAHWERKLKIGIEVWMGIGQQAERVRRA